MMTPQDAQGWCAHCGYVEHGQRGTALTCVLWRLAEARQSASHAEPNTEGTPMGACLLPEPKTSYSKRNWRGGRHGS
jgi:hypothetical protein